MKTQLTKKYVMANYTYVIHVPQSYGIENTLLHYVEPMYYTAGVYGWNADVYDINNYTAIVTGYRPFGNIKPNFRLTEKYCKEAKQILNTLPEGEERLFKITRLLCDWLEEVIDDYKNNK